MAAITTFGSARVARRRAARAQLSEYALLCLTFLVMFVLVYPTGWIFVASFRTPETMFAMRGWVFTVDNYVHLLSSGFARAIFNSLFLCASSVALSTVVAVVAAYVFSRLRFRGKRPLLAAVMLGQTFP
jgi:ABC-type glycerol-3-phosphate transport system permease component